MFEPLDQTRRDILTDHSLLLRATDVWVDHQRRYGGYVRSVLSYNSDDAGRYAFLFNGRDAVPTIDMPRGFKELTALLAYWCDASKFSISPEPLCELGDWFHFALLHGPTHDWGSRDADVFKLSEDALGVIDRMRYTSAASKDIEPPKPVKRPGRPEGSKGSTRKAIEHELSQGTDPVDVAKKYKVTREYVVGIKRELKDEIRQKLSDGQAAADVAEKLDLNAEYVQRIAADMESEVREKLSAGQAAAEVAKELKLNADYVPAIAAELESKKP